MKHIGIVGHAAEKFTPESEQKAKNVIRKILRDGGILVSGHSPMGGIDIWAEEIARELGLPEPAIFTPEQNTWDAPYGFKARNMDIARTADVVHVIVCDEYPPGFDDKKYNACYHCHSMDHIKSGGCWTAIQAEKMGKTAIWHIIRQ